MTESLIMFDDIPAAVKFYTSHLGFTLDFCSVKPKDPRGKPVGFFEFAVAFEHHEIPLARPAIPSAF